MKRIDPTARSSARDELEHRIRAVIDSVPRGRVASYSQIGRIAGLPRHARLVARVLSHLPSGSKLPWHRVINASGRIAVRGSSAVEQRRRLNREGVEVTPKGRIDLARFGWRGD